MRFRFCGNLDCPEWVLANIAILSRLSSIKLRLVVKQVVEYVLREAWQQDKVIKLLTDAKLNEETDLKGCMSVLVFIIESAAKNACEPTELQTELEQLGLPTEHAQSFARIYADNYQAVAETLRQRKNLQLPSLTVKSYNVVKAATQSEIGGAPNDASFANVTFGSLATGEEQNMTIAISKRKLEVLVKSLKDARNIMQQHSVDSSDQQNIQ